MNRQLRSRYERNRVRQRGQAIIFTAVLVALGVLVAILTATGSTSVSIANRQADVTTRALVEARNALVGRAASDGNRPGSLPCPDTNDDGASEIFAGSACPSYIGRLPWKTLGLPDLRDGNGERLWYMLSTRFRDNSAVEPLNSDTKGDITVYLGSTSTVQTLEAVAVIFAPGAVVGNQTRNSTQFAACSVPSGTILTTDCAANYLDLDIASGVNNASGVGPYIIAQSTDTFNDRLLVVTTAELMTPVERRAANEILSLLQIYRSTSGCACYPWADFSDGASSTGDNYGRVPLLGALPQTWASLGITVPTWLTNNRWWWVFFYTIAPSETEWHSAGTLTVDGVSGTSVVLITTGPAGATRPVGSPGTWDNNWWSFYVDDSNNSDMGSNFSTPSLTAYARDRLYKL